MSERTWIEQTCDVCRAKEKSSGPRGTPDYTLGRMSVFDLTFRRGVNGGTRIVWRLPVHVCDGCVERSGLSVLREAAIREADRIRPQNIADEENLKKGAFTV